MYVKHLAADYMNETGASSSFGLLSPTWNNVEHYILGLNGVSSTYVVLSESEDKSSEKVLLIRSPKSGVYFCVYYDGDEYYLCNQNGEILTEPMEMGEFIFHSTIEYVDTKIVLEAAEYFYNQGGRAPALNWVSPSVM